MFTHTHTRAYREHTHTHAHTHTHTHTHVYIPRWGRIVRGLAASCQMVCIGRVLLR